MILHAEVFGEGEPFVFLHTGLQTGESDFSIIKESFQDHYQVILPDLRGHGQSYSENISGNFLDDSVEDLYETLKALDIEKPHVIGCSLGAFVALGFAKKFPNELSSLTISGVMSEKPRNWSEMHKESVAQQTELLKDEQAVGFFNQLHQSDWTQFLHMSKNEDWYPFNLTAEISDIKAPMLFIVGEGNTAEVKTAASYQTMNENLHVCVLPFASHLVHTQKPDIFSAILQEFIDNYSMVKR